MGVAPVWSTVVARSLPELGGLRPDRLLRRLVDLLGPTGGAARQSLVALAFNSVTSFGAGVMLVAFIDDWKALPPMLILVPAAIGLRGNVFATFGNRLSTAIHTGTFRFSARSDTVLGQNLIAAFSLTTLMSVLLAVFAKVIAIAIGVEDSLPMLELIAISVVGGVIGSLVVAAATVGLTRAAVRYEWDLDNLVAPTVSTLGDVVTIPALWFAAKWLAGAPATEAIGGVLVVVAVAVSWWCWRSPHELLRQVFRESTPVLAAALVLSALAGVVLQKQQNLLAELPAIGVLVPAFVSSAGALGGILCGRVATNLHLGSVEPTMAPGPEARRDASLVLSLAAPLVLLNAVGAWAVSSLALGDGAPGFWWVLLAASVASVVTMLFVTAVAYYSTIGAWKVNVDPDSYGVPIVTASVDFVGTLALVFAVVSLGLMS